MSLFQMTATRTYKKHMKHASDLFWIPPNGGEEVRHWEFDETYHEIGSSAFQSDDPQEAINGIFLQRSNKMSGSAFTTDNDMSEQLPGRPFRRSFLTFPLGFCAEIRRTETKGPGMF
jgi:hypothetical protein